MTWKLINWIEHYVGRELDKDTLFEQVKSFTYYDNYLPGYNFSLSEAIRDVVDQIDNVEDFNPNDDYEGIRSILSIVFMLGHQLGRAEKAKYLQDVGDNFTTIEGKTIISDHVSTDWCHLCGQRSRNNVDISYPKNAEHSDDNPTYIRICLVCLLKAVDVIRKERM